MRVRRDKKTRRRHDERGDATTSLHDEMTRGWRSERTRRGRDDSATRGDTTTRCDETARGQCSERTTRGQDGGAPRDDTTTTNLMR